MTYVEYLHKVREELVNKPVAICWVNTRVAYCNSDTKHCFRLDAAIQAEMDKLQKLAESQGKTTVSAFYPDFLNAVTENRASTTATWRLKVRLELLDRFIKEAEDEQN